MRHPDHPMWDLWEKPSTAQHVKTGSLKPHAVCTVEKDWWLQPSDYTNRPGGTPLPAWAGFPYDPIRWWKRQENCVDSETQILTKRGWLTHDKVRVGDHALGIDPATGVARWDEITHLTSAYHESIPMLKMESTGHSSLTTLNHRWLNFDGRWVTSEAMNSRTKIPVAARCDAPERSTYSDDFVELVGWFWTEGTYGRGGGEIYQSVSANPSKVDRIRQCLQREFGDPGPMVLGRSLTIEDAQKLIDGYNSGLSAREVGRRFGVDHTTVMRYVRSGAKSPLWNETLKTHDAPFGTSDMVKFGLAKEVIDKFRKVCDPHSKALTMEFIAGLTQSQRELLIEASMLGDGHYGETAVLTQTANGTYGKHKIESFQALCVLAGYCANLRKTDKIWAVSLRKRKHIRPFASGKNKAQTSAIAERVVYTGTVWCPTLKLGNWLARRNGTVYFTGNSQIETILPPVKSISWERSIDQDVASCTIELLNQKMDDLDGPRDNPNQSAALPKRLGNPGYYTPGRGKSLSRDLYGHSENDWYGVLTPNALIRSFEGYGGHDKTLEDAVEDGNLVLTGVWLVDEVDFRSDGTIVLECRDIGAMLLTQQLYPPLIPRKNYPLRFSKWRWVDEKYKSGTKQVRQGNSRVPVAVTYRDSSNDRWYPGSRVPGRGSPIHGHYPGDSLKDGDSFWLSEGSSHPSRPFCVSWIEYNVGGGSLDSVELACWGGGLSVYVSVMVGGVWQGAPTVPYDHTPLIGHQPHVVDTGADVRYIKKIGSGGPDRAGFRQNVKIPLGRRYNNVQRVRVTFRGHNKTKWGPWFYRAGLYRFRAFRDDSKLVQQAVYSTREVRQQNPLTEPGGYADYTDICKTLLLLAGWWHLPPVNASGRHTENRWPTVWGNFESTSAWADEPLPAEMFDKRPVMDAITDIKQIVGYIFRIGAEGEARFESPGWWRPGNFDEYGKPISRIPLVTENNNLLDYSSRMTNKFLRSEFIISTHQPQLDTRGLHTQRLIPANMPALRGQIAPAEWVNGSFLNSEEQMRMAELLAMHSHFRSRTGQAQVVANPLLDVDMQIRIQEATTAEYFIHYIRGVSSKMDLISGEYTMSLTTNWLGGRKDWAIGFGSLAPNRYTYTITDDFETWSRIDRRLKGRYRVPFNIEYLQYVNADRVAAAGGLVRGLQILLEYDEDDPYALVSSGW